MEPIVSKLSVLLRRNLTALFILMVVVVVSFKKQKLFFFAFALFKILAVTPDLFEFIDCLSLVKMFSLKLIDRFKEYNIRRLQNTIITMYVQL